VATTTLVSEARSKTVSAVVAPAPRRNRVGRTPRGRGPGRPGRPARLRPGCGRPRAPPARSGRSPKDPVHAGRAVRPLRSGHGDQPEAAQQHDAEQAGVRPPARHRGRSLRQQTDVGVGIARVPEHPAGTAELLTCPDLRIELRGAKVALVEGVVLERLQPRPEAHTRQTGPLARALQREVDGLVRGGDGFR